MAITYQREEVIPTRPVHHTIRHTRYWIVLAIQFTDALLQGCPMTFLPIHRHYVLLNSASIISSRNMLRQVIANH